MKFLFIILTIIIIVPSAMAIDFYTTSYIETYRTDLNTTMLSPNLYFKLGKVEGYGFLDRYIDEPRFYHGEFMLAYTPFDTKYLDRLSIIYERRWDKFAPDEHSYGVRLKLWEFSN